MRLAWLSSFSPRTQILLKPTLVPNFGTKNILRDGSIGRATAQQW
jgi:hypothetical protein